MQQGLSGELKDQEFVLPVMDYTLQYASFTMPSLSDSLFLSPFLIGQEDAPH